MSKKPEPVAKTAPAKKAVTPAVKAVVKEALKSAGVTVKPVFAKPAVNKPPVKSTAPVTKPSAAAKTTETKTTKVEVVKTKSSPTPVKTAANTSVKVAQSKDVVVKKPATKAEVNKAMRDQMTAGNSLKVTAQASVKPPVGGLGKNAANDFAKAVKPMSVAAVVSEKPPVQNQNIQTLSEIKPQPAAIYSFEEVLQDIEVFEKGIATAYGRVVIFEGLSLLQQWRKRGSGKFTSLYSQMFATPVNTETSGSIRTFIDRVNEFARTKMV